MLAANLSPVHFIHPSEAYVQAVAPVIMTPMYRSISSNSVMLDDDY
jgi:hypothetical protein